jgi:hypothetical protein
MALSLRQTSRFLFLCAQHGASIPVSSRQRSNSLNLQYIPTVHTYIDFLVIHKPFSVPRQIRVRHISHRALN